MFLRFHLSMNSKHESNLLGKSNIISVCFRKYHVEAELEAAKKWSVKWGFLTTPFEELIKDERKEPTKPKIELPEHLQIRPITPVEKYIKVYPSPPIPKTTQDLLAGDHRCQDWNLNVYYQIRSCKGAFHKDLKWPDEPSD
uniref:Ciliary microtubule inner protein 1 n=1 Tax=Gopherus evgoodei TaxID=1825980 RepID=A0A8C4WD91_9SAUR